MQEMFIFSHQNQHYAITANIVEEILQPLNITATPHTDDIVDGLLNVHGKIILLFNFSRIITKHGIDLHNTSSFPEEEKSIRKKKTKQKKTSSNSLNNILLINQNQYLHGLYIEDVIGKAVISEDSIRRTDPQKTSIYAGQFLYDKKIVILISLDSILKYIEPEDKKLRPKNHISFGHSTTLDESEQRKIRADDVNFLITRINNSYFGIDINEIQELIILNEITPVPFLPKKVIGLTDLRDQPLIVLSLPHIIYDEDPSTTYQYGIVAKSKNGLVIFAIHDLFKIERFERNSRHLIAKQDHEIKGWLKRNDNSFSAIIDLKTILESPLFDGINGYINKTELIQMPYLTPDSKRYLITKIEDEYCGIALDSIKIVIDEINIQELPLSSESNTKPEYTRFIKGIAQVHGEIIYVFDTYKLLNKKSCDYKNYVIISIDNRRFAFPIQNVEMVISVHEYQVETLSSSENIINKIAKVEKKLISILDPTFVLQYLPRIGAL